MTTGAFKESHFTFEDWREAISRGQTAWGDPLPKDQCKIRGCDPQDDNDRQRLLETQNPAWHCSGHKPKHLRHDAFRASVPSVLWIARGPIIIFCSLEDAAELLKILKSLSRPKLALATS